MAERGRRTTRKFPRLIGAVTVPPLLAAAIAYGGILPTQSASAELAPLATECIPTGEVYFAGGESNFNIHVYDQAGTYLRTINPPRAYGDIAVLPDGRIFGVNLSGLLEQLDQNGNVVRSVQLAGTPGVTNALSVKNDNTLYLGGRGSGTVYEVDITDFASRSDVPQLAATPYSLPAGSVSSGDYFQLGGTSLLGIGNSANGSTLWELHDDGSAVSLGTVPLSFGAGRIGDALFLGTESGNPVKIDDYAALTPSDAPIATTPFAGYFGGQIYGGSSSVEGSYCLSVAPASASGNQGAPVSINPNYKLGMAGSSAEFVRANIPAGATLTDDGKTLAVPGEGVWQIAGDGAITFVPESESVARVTRVSYSANDSSGQFSAQPALLTVTFPDVADVTGMSNNGAPVSLTPNLGVGVAADSVRLMDPATGQPTEGPIVVPDQGTWTLDAATGTIRFEPLPTLSQSPTPIGYTAALADNPEAWASPAMATAAFGNVDDLSSGGDQGTPVTIPANLGQDMAPGSVSLINPVTGAVTNGDVTVPGEGVWTIDTATGDVTFVPEANFAGVPSPIEYTAQTVAGAGSLPATISVDYPDVVDINATGAGGQPITVESKLGPEMVPASVRMVDADGVPVEGPLAVPGEGTWSVDSTNGNITFTPEPAFNGIPSVQKYTAQNQAGHLAMAARVAVNNPDVWDIEGIAPVGKPATLPAGLGKGVDPTTVQLIDPATGTAAVEQRPNGRTQPRLAVPGEGTWSVNTVTGAIKFTPEKGMRSSPTPIQYTASDSLGNTAVPASAKVTYPEVYDSEFSGFTPGQPATVVPNLGPTVLPDTIKLISPYTFRRTDGPVNVPGEGTWTVDPDTGSVTFTPEPGFTGSPSPIDFTGQDENGNWADPATINITYNPVPESPDPDPVPEAPQPGYQPGGTVPPPVAAPPQPYAAIDTGAADASQSFSGSLIAGGAALALLAMVGLGMILRHRRSN